VGLYLADNFESTYQKVGTFRVVNGQKQGGNVATYFCLADGTVVHAVAGVLTAKQFLQEARWAVDTRKLAITQAGGDVTKYRGTLRKGHQERLTAEHGLTIPAAALPKISPYGPPVPQAGTLRLSGARGAGQQGQVHALLAYHPLPKLDQLYPIVFEQILGEKLSTLPVVVK
jgi:hypothetical protein